LEDETYVNAYCDNVIDAIGRALDLDLTEKFASRAITAAPLTRAVAAIQMSLVGTGGPASLRFFTKSAYFSASLCPMLCRLIPFCERKVLN